MTAIEAMPVETITPPPTNGREKPDPYKNAPSDKLFEVLNGSIVEKTMSAYEMWLASDIQRHLAPYCDQHNLGRSMVEVMFVIPSRQNDRKPDVAFLSYKRWAKNRPVPRVNAWPVVPELVVEVVSPNDTFFKVVAKVHEYFEAGVSIVWLIVSHLEQAYVYTSPNSVTILNRDGELSGGDVIPGFRLPMRELFPETAVEATP